MIRLELESLIRRFGPGAKVKEVIEILKKEAKVKKEDNEA